MCLYQRGQSKEADLNLNSGKIKKLEELEKDSIMEALKVSDGNITSAAQQLGIARNTFYVKMKKYEISRKNFQDKLLIWRQQKGQLF